MQGLHFKKARCYFRTVDLDSYCPTLPNLNLANGTIERSPGLSRPVSETFYVCVFTWCSPHRRLCSRRDVFATLPRRNPHDVHRIDLLESPALTFHEEEVDNHRGGETAPRENIAIPKVDGRRDERGKESDEEIPEPIRGDRDGHTLCPVTGGIELCDDGPNHRSPGAGERGNEQASEYDHGDTSLRSVFRGPLVQGEVTDRCKYHETDEHPQSSCNQTFSTTESFDEVEARESHDDVHCTEDDLSFIAVVKAGRAEDTVHGQQTFRASHKEAESYLVP